MRGRGVPEQRRRRRVRPQPAEAASGAPPLALDREHRRLVSGLEHRAALSRTRRPQAREAATGALLRLATPPRARLAGNPAALGAGCCCSSLPSLSSRGRGPTSGLQALSSACSPLTTPPRSHPEVIRALCPRVLAFIRSERKLVMRVKRLVHGRRGGGREGELSRRLLDRVGASRFRARPLAQEHARSPLE